MLEATNMSMFNVLGYLEALLKETFSKEKNPSFYAQVITPTDPAQRGCQLSVKFSIPVKKLKPELDKRCVVVSVFMPGIMLIDLFLFKKGPL